MIPYIRAYLRSWHTWLAAKEATYYTGVNVQSNRWTGSILRSSSYNLIDWHWFLWRYLVVFKVSFCNEVVTPGVIVTSALTSAKCQHHRSSVWPWSGAPKVRLYDTFLGGLPQLDGDGHYDGEMMYLEELLGYPAPTRLISLSVYLSVHNPTLLQSQMANYFSTLPCC